MCLLWVVLWSMQPHLTLSSGPNHCSVPENSNSHNVSLLLASLHCQNDYESHLDCWWTGDGNTTLQLWLQTENSRKVCEQHRPPGHDGTVRCRIEDKTWAIGVKHTFFFLNNGIPAACSFAKHKAVLQPSHLRTRPPSDLAVQDTADGGTRVSWSSPYPGSPSLSQKLMYQLRYRTHTQDNWTTTDVNDTHVELEKHSLLPGHRYEATVRSRASVGQWSGWTPTVTWQTQEEPGQPPRLHCVLDGEMEVTCSWETSTELAHFVSYQLVCRFNLTAQPETCCPNPTVSSDINGTVLRYSCSLTGRDPAHLVLELQPIHNTKILDPNKHIRPKPPQKVKLKENGNNWVVEWTKPSTPIPLIYELCFCRTHHQEPCKCLNSTVEQQIIPGERLVPSQEYLVKVRALVNPAEGSTFKGVPSEWTEPERLTSHPAAWSITNILYVVIGLIVAVVFFAIYCAFPKCRRRVVLWVDSVPSPGKSKILSEIKSATSRPLMQNEDTSICKVLHFDSVSTCSSNASLWPMKESDQTCLEPDEGVWNCEHLSGLAEKVGTPDTSSMSFSGPYIFCQTSKKSVDAQHEEQGKEDTAPADSSPSPVSLGIFGEGYVCLPSRALSRSTQDLVSHSGANKNAQVHGGSEQEPQRLDTAPWTGKTTNVQPDLGEPTGGDQPPAYTAEPFSPWPRGGHVQASGYCFLPQPT